jgi:hypothetical protein
LPFRHRRKLTYHDGAKTGIQQKTSRQSERSNQIENPRARSKTTQNFRKNAQRGNRSQCIGDATGAQAFIAGEAEGTWKAFIALTGGKTTLAQQKDNHRGSRARFGDRALWSDFPAGSGAVRHALRLARDYAQTIVTACGKADLTGRHCRMSGEEAA